MDSELSHHAVPAYVSREVATNFADSRISTGYRDPEKPHHSEKWNLDFTEATSGNCGSRKASPQGGSEGSDGRGLVTIPARNRAGSRESSPLALEYGRKAGFSRKDSLIERHLSRSISPTPCRARKRRWILLFWPYPKSLTFARLGELGSPPARLAHRLEFPRKSSLPRLQARQPPPESPHIASCSGSPTSPNLITDSSRPGSPHLP